MTTLFSFTADEDSESHGEKLDAHGHLNWTVGSKEEDDGVWMACFDASYEEVTNTIVYHVVVDGGNFVITPEKGRIPAHDSEKVSWLKTIPERWHEVGYEAADGLEMDGELLKETLKDWVKHIDSLAAQAIDPDDECAVNEQSADFFDRYISGD